MHSVSEYIIAGGPQHGRVLQRPPAADTTTAAAIVTEDGHRCLPAAFQQSGTRLVLLHPEATGSQFRTILAA